MSRRKRVYAAIDLKSFYASVECQERGLDPLNVNLVVADESRTDRTICLAVSPALKSYGISGRPRLFEVKQAVAEINRQRREKIGMRPFRGVSAVREELEKDPCLELGFHVAVPRMALYISYSTDVYSIYLRYLSPQDIHVYSIDEVIMDLTDYLGPAGMSAREMTMRMIHDVMSETGITATAGIGTNMYLAKAAMDIVAKHIPADQAGVRIAFLDEEEYRRRLWDHRPLTDFWRIGRGIAAKLEKNGLFTMGDVARCSISGENGEGENFLFDLFGVNAELLIDHAWGREPCTMEAVKKYRPAASSLGAGQVLSEPYSFEKARLIIKEMCDQLALDLVEKGLVTDELTLSVGYEYRISEEEEEKRGVHGSVRLGRRTSSSSLMRQALLGLYDRLVNSSRMVRRISIAACRVMDEKNEGLVHPSVQYDLFTDMETEEKREKQTEKEIAREKRMQKAIVMLHRKFGKNSVMRGMNLEDGATARERNGQIGGHKA